MPDNRRFLGHLPMKLAASTYNPITQRVVMEVLSILQQYSSQKRTGSVVGQSVETKFGPVAINEFHVELAEELVKLPVAERVDYGWPAHAASPRPDSSSDPITS